MAASTLRYFDETRTWSVVGGFVSGTTMMFLQAAAPIGWTRVSTYDDALLRIVGSATPSSGGSNGFVATFNSQTTTGAHQLVVAEMPSHTHAQESDTVTQQAPGSIGYMYDSAQTHLLSTRPSATGSTGGDGTHSHTITTGIKYVDSLVASMN
jgi:hypothetical protein